MRVIRALFYLMGFSILLRGCVERFYPDEDDIIVGTLVVNAHLKNVPGIQTISISRSDKLLYPQYRPQSDCSVEVENQEGTVVAFSETIPGDYAGEITADFLKEGTLYKLQIVTSNGARYESEYSQLRSSTKIDSIYYELEYHPTSDPSKFIEGIRFFIDFEVDPDSSEYMRWELIETYEFRNPNHRGLIYGYDRILKPLPDSLDDRQCWITGFVNSIFTLDAGNFNSQEYTYMPLNFVSNETQRLSYGYSLLVRQFAMDEAAFRYWDELKNNSQEMSGMYDRQPSLTPSNICNYQDPDEKILGFFSVSGLTEKRVFVKEVEGMDKYNIQFCTPYPEMPRLRYLMTADLPVYMSEQILPNGGGIHRGETILDCLDCRVRKGSSGDPPDYWPRE